MSRGRQITGLLICILLSFAAGGIGALFTTPAVAAGGWYATLPKPPWTPPGWLFAPVWSTLYLLMGVAAWLVWRARGSVRAAAAPLALFAIQLLLNASWSIIFFGLHQVGFAVVELALLWLAILLTLVACWRVRPLAGALLLPYLAWVSFAGVLNYAVWRLQG